MIGGSENPQPAESLERGNPWFLLAIVLLAFALRAWNLHGEGFTADEVSEVLASHVPVVSMLLDEDDDQFPPLYRLALGLSVRLTGSDLTARWLSVLCGTAVIFVVWGAGAELLGKRDGWWPALLLATCPFHIHYSREGRAYAFFFFFCCLAIWAMLRLLRNGSVGNWCLLAAGSLAAIYTHYFAVPLLAAVWLISLLGVQNRDARLRGLIAALCVTIGTLPAFYLLRRAMLDFPVGKLVSTFDVEALGYTYMLLVSGFTLGPSMRELRTLSASEGIALFLPWIATVGCVLLVLSYYALQRLRSSRGLLPLLFLLLFLVPAIGWSGNLAGVGFVYRYVLWLAFPFVLWVAAGAACSKSSRLAMFATVALLLLNVIAVGNGYMNPRYQGEDFRATARYLTSQQKEPRPILVASPYMAQALRYYLPEDWEVDSFPIFSQLEEPREKRVAEFLASLDKGEPYWFLSQWLPKDDIRRQTRDAIRERLASEFITEVGMMEIYKAVR